MPSDFFSCNHTGCSYKNKNRIIGSYDSQMEMAIALSLGEDIDINIGDINIGEMPLIEPQETPQETPKIMSLIPNMHEKETAGPSMGPSRKRRGAEHHHKSVHLAFNAIRRRTTGFRTENKENEEEEEESDVLQKLAEEAEEVTISKTPCYEELEGEGEEEASSLVVNPCRDNQKVLAVSRRLWYSEGEKVLVRAPELSEGSYETVLFYNALVKSADDLSSPPIYNLEIIDDSNGTWYRGSSLTVRKTPDTMFLHLLKQEEVWLRVGSSSAGSDKNKEVVVGYEKVLIQSVDMSQKVPDVWCRWPKGSEQAKAYPREFRTTFECITKIKATGDSSKRALASCPSSSTATNHLSSTGTDVNVICLD